MMTTLNPNHRRGAVAAGGGWASYGSLFDHMAAAIDQRIEYADPATQKSIFSVMDHTTPNYVRSQPCWAADINLTCASPWNSTGVHQRAGTLVSPRHVIFATHYLPDVGATIRFVNQANEVLTRTITAFSSNIGLDITVGALSADLPDGVSFARVLPENWTDFTVSAGVPCLYTDQTEKALCTVFTSFDFNVFATSVPVDPTRLSFYELQVGGDSGSPLFVIINRTPVLIGTNYTTDVGDSLAWYRDDVNAAMISLGGGYQLTDIDLTGFSRL